MAWRSSGNVNVGTSTSVVITVPAGAAVNDIMVAAIYVETANAITPPDGTWTNKADLAASPTAHGRLSVWWKRCTGADTGTYTFSWSGNTQCAASVMCMSNRVTSGDPFDATPGTFETPSAITTCNVATTPVSAGVDLVGFWTSFNNTFGTWTAPTNYTTQTTTGVLGAYTRESQPATATGNVTATSNSAAFMKAFLGALKPAVTIVGSAQAQSAAANSITATLPTTPVNGNTLIAVIGYGATDTPTLPTNGGTWSWCPSQPLNNGTVMSGIAYCANISGATTATSITCATTNSKNMTVYEVAGLAATTPLDKSNAAQYTSNTVGQAGTTGTLSQVPEFVAAGMHVQAAITSLTIDSGFTKDTDFATLRCGSARLIAVATTALNPTWTWVTARGGTAAIASFKAAVAAPAAPPRPVRMLQQSVLRASAA